MDPAFPFHNHNHNRNQMPPPSNFFPSQPPTNPAMPPPSNFHPSHPPTNPTMPPPTNFLPPRPPNNPTMPPPPNFHPSHPPPNPTMPPPPPPHPHQHQHQQQQPHHPPAPALARQQAIQDLTNLQILRRSALDVLRDANATEITLVALLEEIEQENAGWGTPNARLDEIYRLREEIAVVKRRQKECHRQWDELGEEIEKKHIEVAFGESGDD